MEEASFEKLTLIVNNSLIIALLIYLKNGAEAEYFEDTSTKFSLRRKHIKHDNLNYTGVVI